jgi:FkbM family methyltransferase
MSQSTPAQLFEQFIPDRSSIKHIVEAGGADLRDTKWLVDHFPAAEIDVFEPDTAHLPAIHAALKTLPRTNFWPLALAEKAGTQNWFRSSNGAFSSSLLPAGPAMAEKYNWIQVTPAGTVQCVTLDDWCNRVERWPDLMWLDLQGCELQVLRGSPELLKRVKYLYLEVLYCELYANNPLASDLDKFLTANGFELLNHQAEHEGIYGNSLYRRKENPAAPAIIPLVSYAQIGDQVLQLDHQSA